MNVNPAWKQPAPAKAKKRGRPSELKANSLIVLERAQGCEACDLIAAFVPGWDCSYWPVDVHHRRRQGPGRTKGGGHMVANLRVVCRKSHDWIHHVKNRDMARSLGLLVMPEDSEFESLALRRLG